MELDQWLDALLAEHGLTNRELILVGFSQGAILATVCGTRRGVRGVVAVGGVPGQPVYDREVDDYVGGGWMDWEQLVPAAAAARTRFCLVNGTQDGFVDRRKNERMLAEFDATWHWEDGVGHDFPEHWYGLALDWIKLALAGPAI